MTTITISMLILTNFTAFVWVWWVKRHNERLIYTFNAECAARLKSENLAKDLTQRVNTTADIVYELRKQIGAPKDTICLPELSWWQDVQKLRQELKDTKQVNIILSEFNEKVFQAAQRADLLMNGLGKRASRPASMQYEPSEPPESVSMAAPQLLTPNGARK